MYYDDDESVVSKRKKREQEEAMRKWSESIPDGAFVDADVVENITGKVKRNEERDIGGTSTLVREGSINES